MDGILSKAKQPNLGITAFEISRKENSLHSAILKPGNPYNPS